MIWKPTREEIMLIDKIIMESPTVKAWAESLSKGFIAYKTLRLLEDEK